MKTQEIKQECVSVYWWNFGKKTLDYKGTVEGLFKNKGIKDLRISENKYRFIMSIGSGLIRFDTTGDYADACFTAIKLFMCYLGDRTLITFRGKSYTLNK